MKILFITLFLICASAFIGVKALDSTPQTVSGLDLERYQGTWYEVARLPQTFQEDCAAVRVNYELLEDRVKVLNQCVNKTDGSLISADGTAFVVDSETNAKLKVSFVPFFQRWGWFAGDYWVFAIDSNYQYAMVGSPSGSGLWLLSRTPMLDEKIKKDLLDYAAYLGFDLRDLIQTPAWDI